MDNFKNLLRLAAIDSLMVRFGNKGDGGYVLPQLLIDKTEVIYSYGVGSDVSFEIDFVKEKNIRCRIFDHTVDAPSSIIYFPEIIFCKEGLSTDVAPSKNSFMNHRKIYLDEDKKILLKIDIEGGEYKIFQDEKKFNFDNICGLIIELHDIGFHKKLAKSILSKFNENFLLVHVHGNNYGRFFEDEFTIYPDTMELTYINRGLIDQYVLTELNPLPIKGLDYPCNGEHLDFPNYLNSENYSKLIEIFNSLSDLHREHLKSRMFESINSMHESNFLKHSLQELRDANALLETQVESDSRSLQELRDANALLETQVESERVIRAYVANELRVALNKQYFRRIFDFIKSSLIK